MEKNQNLYQENLVSKLYDIKRAKGEITEEDLKEVSKNLDIPLAKVYQAASFYEFPQDKKIDYYNVITGHDAHIISRQSCNLEAYDYAALKKSLSQGQEFTLNEVEKSQLRGRGGAGFLAARKWKSCRKSQGSEKYLIANGHNGDPGSNSDRYLMAYHPHQLIEGMLLAGYAIGASNGIIYIEGKFQDAVKNLEESLKQAYENNLLGKNILSSQFNFDIKIFEAAGVYVCGESTALMRAIEGKTGEPRVKHVHTAEKGVFDKPTVLNNVETLINVPRIINMGGEEYAKTGTETSKGTKIFTLTGDTRHKGIVEVAMGTPLSQVIGVYGLGTIGKLKGVQFGGPLGGFLPENMIETPVCFDALSKAGSMMGDALTVISDRTSVADVTEYFIKFLADQSCGKCVSCKEGLRRLEQLLQERDPEDLELILRIAKNAKESSLCQLGQSIYNPVSTAIKHFKEDFKKR